MSVRLHSLKTPAIVVASLVAAYLLFGWLALPLILESQAKQYIAETGHRLTLDRPVFNPFNLKLRVSNLHLDEPGGKSLFAFRDLTVDLSASSLFRRALVLDAIRLDEPQATLVLKHDGQLNWLPLIGALKGKEESKESEAQEESPLFRFAIGSFIMAGGSLDFADDKTGFATRFNPINFELSDISSLPDKRDSYWISARTDSARLLWQGQAALNPLGIYGALAIEDLEVARLAPYVKAVLPIPPTSGSASLSAAYRIRYTGGRFDLSLENIAAKIKDFRLSAAGKSGPEIAVDIIEAKKGRYDLSANKFGLGTFTLAGSRIGLPGPHAASTELLQLAKVTLDRVEADLAGRSVTVDRVALTDGRLKAVRNAKGGIDVVDALRGTITATRATPVAKTDAKTPSLPWHYRANKVEVTDLSATFRDETVAPPADLTLDDIALSVDGISDNPSAPLPIRGSAQARDGGKLTAVGQVIPGGPSADLKVTLVDLALKPAQPYVTSMAKLRLTDGRISTEGRGTYDKRGVRYAGGFAVRNLRVVEAGTNDVFLAWKFLGSRRFEVTQDRLDIGKLDIVHPENRLIISKDRSININDILKKPGAVTVSSTSPPSAPTATSAPAPVPSIVASAPAPVAPAQAQAPPAEPAKKTPSFLVNVDRVKITGGEMDFADHSLVLPFETHIHDLGGFINGISSRPGALAQIELDGQIDEHGVARGVGQMELFNPTQFTDVTVMFSNVEMTELSPYSTTFAGRKIDSGKLRLNLEYKIKGRQLEGKNQIVIDKVKLGERVESAQAMDLPLDLAVSMLEDSEGRIDLGLPVSGSLDDPEFSYGAVIWKAIVNLFTKIVTAPFRALLSLFGGGAEIENVYFDPGAAKLSPPEQENVTRLAGLLNKRPGLSMTVHGTYSDADRVALQDLQLRRAVAAEAGFEVAPDEDPGPLSTTSPKVQEALESLYSDRASGAELRALKEGFRKANPGQMEESTMGKMMSRLSNLFGGKQTLREDEVGKLKGADFHAVLFQRLRARETVTDAQMQSLAAARGEITYTALKAADAPADRLTLGAPEKADSDEKGVAVKVDLGTAPKPAAASPTPN